jgi:hypothetical protein
MQHRLAAIALETPQTVSNLTILTHQQIMQAIEFRNSQRSFKNTAISGKCESVGNPFQS